MTMQDSFTLQKVGGLENRRVGRSEGLRVGRLEGRRVGRVECWRVGRSEGRRWRCQGAKGVKGAGWKDGYSY